MKRIFLALIPDKATALDIYQAATSWTWPPSSKRYSAEDLHSTLHFIGSVAKERLPEISQSVHILFEPFTLTLDTPHLWHGGLVVLCPTTIPEAMVRLHKGLAQVLHDLNLPMRDHALAPHVTLARHCQGMEVPVSCPPIRWQVEDYALVVSTGNAHQRYEVFSRYTGQAVPGRPTAQI